MDETPGENLIRGETITEQTIEAARIEADKITYRHPEEALADTAAGLRRLHQAPAQPAAPLAITELGRFLTLARLGGQGLSKIVARQNDRMAIPRILVYVHTEGPITTTSPTLDVAKGSLVLPLYSTNNLCIDEAAAWTEVHSPHYSLHTALFIGQAAVGVCTRHFAAKPPSA